MEDLNNKDYTSAAGAFILLNIDSTGSWYIRRLKLRLMNVTECCNFSNLEWRLFYFILVPVVAPESIY